MRTQIKGSRKGVSILTVLSLLFALLPAALPAHALPIAEGIISQSPVTQMNFGVRGSSAYVDPETETFAVYREGEVTGVPQYIGRVEWKEGRRQWVATRKITAAENLYLLTDPGDENFLQVMERLPEGGFGRLLKHRDAGIDLEFVYNDELGEVTILDYTIGLYYRVTHQEKREVPVSVAPSKEDQVTRADLAATVVSSPKFTGVSSFVTVPEKKKTPTESLVEGLVQERLRNRRHLRGPPIEELYA